MHYMIQMSARAGLTATLKSWCLDILGPQILDRRRQIERLIVNVATEAPQDQPYGGGESQQGEQYDVVLQIWVSGNFDLTEALHPWDTELARLVVRQDSYRLSETVVLERADLLAGVPSPGLKLLRGLYFFDDMSDFTAKRCWSHHAHLATKVHVGMARYVRHWVEEILTPNSPHIRGLSELHFPSDEAMRERYFDSPRGREEILHDIGHFISGGTHRIYAKEYILK